MSQTTVDQSGGTNAPPMGPISITEKAAAQVKSIKERENRADAYLRVSVIGGGCSGLSYKLSFEDQPKEKDQVVDVHSVKMLVDPKSLLFLKGIVIDFTDGLEGQGFVFTNPNAKQSCGCGTSFSA
jgi:iron-sulfur cluster assembly protein